VTDGASEAGLRGRKGKRIDSLFPFFDTGSNCLEEKREDLGDLHVEKNITSEVEHLHEYEYLRLFKFFCYSCIFPPTDFGTSIIFDFAKKISTL